MWELIVEVGFATWFFAACALALGIVMARAILIPDGAACDSRAQQLARCRTITGFGFLAALSLPYRSIDDSLDKAWGNFNSSVPIALAVFVLLGLIFWLILSGSRDRASAEWPQVWYRFGKFVVALALSWVALYVAEVASKRLSPEWARLELVILGEFAGLFAMGCWCISGSSFLSVVSRCRTRSSAWA